MAARQRGLLQKQEAHHGSAFKHSTNSHPQQLPYVTTLCPFNSLRLPTINSSGSSLSLGSSLLDSCDPAVRAVFHQEKMFEVAENFVEELYAPQAFTPGHIALSYMVSFIGSLSTVELLQRRTSTRGLYNWYLLAGSALTMGGVAIWAMHYIGNRAIVLYPASPGRNGLQLSYSPGFTALSFFVPVIFLMLAYLLMGTASEVVGWPRLGTGGTFAGLSICGMHYLGQAGISNYDTFYVPGHIVGSIVIAVVATTVALTLFFILRKNFTNTLYKRALCAVVLSGAVTGMHWTAALGTRYRLKPNSGLTRDTRQMTVVITIVMSVVSCVLALLFAIAVNRSRAHQHNRAQKIILASATFDREGRLMVLPDGMMPTKEITDSFREKSFEEGFDKSHAVFQWLYRTTRHWKSLNGLIEGMKAHIRQYNAPNRPHDSIEDYGFIFREQFCLAAQELADSTHRTLGEMGVLYDNIIITGGAIPGERKKSCNDVESGIGRGKFLFLVKGVDRSDALRLTAHGYRFTNPDNVTENIARSLQVHNEGIRAHVKSMGSCASAEHELSPGVFLGCFAVRANVKGGFDVLVRTDARSQLPMVRLPLTTLGQSHLRFLKEQEGKTVTRVMDSLQAMNGAGSCPPNSQPLVTMFHNALQKLIQDLDDPFFAEAMLILQPIAVPCLNPIDNEIGTAFIIIFKTIVSIHSRTVTFVPKFEFTPLAFFSLQQRCYPFSPDHDIHSRRTHREFSGRAAQIPRPLKPRFSGTFPPWQSKDSGPNATTTTLSSGNSHASSSSEENLMHNPPIVNPFANGGIMVSQSVSIEHAEANSGIEMHAMGPSAAVVKEEDMEKPTWVELLFKGVISPTQ